MRLDQFLKVSRLVKRRTIAREMCDAGRVLLNGREAKPAREIKPGDLITLKYYARVIEGEVLEVVAPGAGKKLPPAPFRITTDKRLTETKPSQLGLRQAAGHERDPSPLPLARKARG